jgi:transposase-like protein
MKKTKQLEGQCCPRCGKTEGQVCNGHNKSGTQRCRCNSCGCSYTLEPKTRAYSEEVRQSAIKAYYMGVSGRGIGKIHNMSKANVYNWIKKNENPKSGSAKT